MTLKKRVVPCLDVKGGRVVKGVQFENLRDAGDPAELAVRYEEEGGDEVVFLDISASVDQRKTTLKIVGRTAENLFIPLTVGGGIRSLEDVQDALNAGADKVSFNTAAILNPAIIPPAAARFGAQCIVVAIDAKRRDANDATKGWEIFTHGGTKPTGLDAIEWARKVVDLGAGELLVTSMDRDGTRVGYDLALTRAMSDAVTVPIIASGGAGNAEHLAEALTDGGADAALAASIFHDREITVREVKGLLQDRGVAVRVA